MQNTRVKEYSFVVGGFLVLMLQFNLHTEEEEEPAARLPSPTIPESEPYRPLMQLYCTNDPQGLFCQG